MQIEKISQDMDQLGISEANTKSAEDVVIDDLLHRLQKETAITDGAKNMIKALRAQKAADHKALSDVILGYVFFLFSNLRHLKHSCSQRRKLILFDYL